MPRLGDTKRFLASLSPSRPGISIRESKSIPNEPGVYVISSGDCISHIGEGGHMRDRVETLRRLGTHRGSDEVLCAAHCTHESPVVHWELVSGDRRKRLDREGELESMIGEPPSPQPEFRNCIHGRKLCEQLLQNCTGWQQGYIKATFEIGEQLAHLFHPKFDRVWRKVGKPPGWEDFIFEGMPNYPL